jgi:hypothetical protein
MLLIYGQEDAPAPLPEDKVLEAYGEWVQKAQADGAYQSGERLRGAGEAASVRVRNGSTLVTDGPFAETKETLGGFFIVEAKDRDAAVAYAAKIPGALGGTIEVRPVWEMG